MAIYEISASPLGTSELATTKVVAGAHPIQWGLLSENTDAIFRVTAYDVYGNQLQFYTGTKDSPTLTSSDGSSDDGILLCDLSGMGDASPYAGLAYLLMTQSASTAHWVCKDTSTPGMPEGTAQLFIELTSPDSGGNGVTMTPVGWDFNRDGLIDSTNVTVLQAGDWYTNRGLSPSLISGYTPRLDSSARVRLVNIGDSTSIGWGI